MYYLLDYKENMICNVERRVHIVVMVETTEHVTFFYTNTLSMGRERDKRHYERTTFINVGQHKVSRDQVIQ